MNQALLQYYRCPENFADFEPTGKLSEGSGFSQFAEDALCLGLFEGTSIQLPFDPSEVIENLRRERYLGLRCAGKENISQRTLRSAYYLARPALPVSVRKHLQRLRLRGWEKRPFPSWPVDRTVENIVEKLLVLSLKAHTTKRIPFIWFWPDGAPSAAVMTHDVEEQPGQTFCSQLMDLDDSAGIKASFQIVPEERYPVPPSFLDSIRARGFEINVHDLNHDCRLFVDRRIFLQRVQKINRYGKEFGAAGFRSGALYRNLDWFGELDFAYDMLVPNVAHLDPQPGGCCTVMPYFLHDILEIPVTTTQDYTLFHIFDDYSINLWKRQIELIMDKHGLISFIVHPDYIHTAREQSVYEELLRYLICLREEKDVWIATPGEVNRWWRARSQMKLVRRGSNWEIQGRETERARLAFAVLDGDGLSYEITGAYPGPSHAQGTASQPKRFLQ